MLQHAGVLLIVRELEAAGAAQHVRVNWERPWARLADPRQRFCGSLLASLAQPARFGIHGPLRVLRPSRRSARGFLRR